MRRLGIAERAVGNRLLTGTATFVMGATLAGVGEPALAQAAGPQTAAPKASELEEVVVTAQRRTENLQKVPISATVLSAARLRSEGVTDLQSLTSQVPGLSIAPPASGQTYINIRGVGQQQTSTTVSDGVAFYVDGVFIPTQRTYVDAIYDIGSVEVLRGPQGTLVGENSTGGAILINSKGPEFGALGGYFQQTFGDYSERRSEGAVNLPISDQFAARVAFVTEQRSSFTTNLGGGAGLTGRTNFNEPGNVDTSSARLQLAYRPSAQLKFDLRYETFVRQDNGPAIKPLEYSIPTSSRYYDPVSASLQNSPFTIDTDSSQSTHISGQRASLAVNWDVTSFMKIRSISTYQDGRASDSLDVDLGLAPGNGQLNRTFRSKVYTQEINLISTSSGPLQWVVGGFYLHSQFPLQAVFSTAASTADPYGARVSVGPALNVAEHTGQAIFAQASYKLLPSLTLTAGGRYTQDVSPFKVTLPTPNSLVTKSTQPTWRGAIDWQANDNALIYAFVATGYKAGGENNVGLPFSPETNTVEEVGVKTTLFDKRLRINLAAFDSQYNNIQVSVFRPLVPGGSLRLASFRMPPKRRLPGVSSKPPGRLGTLGSIWAQRISMRENSNQFKLLATPIPVGQRLAYAPSWTINGGIDYTIHDWREPHRLQGVYNYVGKQATDLRALPFTQLPERSSLDLRLTYYAPHNWSLEGYVTNVTNRVNVAAVYGTPLGDPLAIATRHLASSAAASATISERSNDGICMPVPCCPWTGSLQSGPAPEIKPSQSDLSIYDRTETLDPRSSAGDFMVSPE